MGKVCGRRVFEKNYFFWRRLVWSFLGRYCLAPADGTTYTRRVRACGIRTKSDRVACYKYVLGICIIVCASGPRAREEAFMQVRCKVRRMRAADAEMQLLCVGLGLRALNVSLRGQIQLSAMNREKA